MSERQKLFQQLMQTMEGYSREAACAVLTAYLTDEKLREIVLDRIQRSAM